VLATLSDHLGYAPRMRCDHGSRTRHRLRKDERRRFVVVCREEDDVRGREVARHAVVRLSADKKHSLFDTDSTGKVRERLSFFAVADDEEFRVRQRVPDLSKRLNRVVETLAGAQPPGGRQDRARREAELRSNALRRPRTEQLRVDAVRDHVHSGLLQETRKPGVPYLLTRRNDRLASPKAIPGAVTEVIVRSRELHCAYRSKNGHRSPCPQRALQTRLCEPEKYAVEHHDDGHPLVDAAAYMFDRTLRLAVEHVVRELGFAADELGVRLSEPNRIALVCRGVDEDVAHSVDDLLRFAFRMGRRDHVDLVAGSGQATRKVARMVLHAADPVHRDDVGNDADPHPFVFVMVLFPRSRQRLESLDVRTKYDWTWTSRNGNRGEPMGPCAPRAAVRRLSRMCGIAGTLDLGPGLPSAEDLVGRMTDHLVHRGPNGAGMLVLPPVVLGNRRLSILDLSSAADQPMASEDGRFWLTYNGEIYNYKELARDLRSLGHRFRSSGDTDVLLHTFMEWGTDALARLNGMFAFALWDTHRQELLCVRDRLGVKPFYYTVAGGRFRFASEIKALLIDPEVARRPNDARIVDFLAHSYADHTDETMFDGIYQLPPGSFMRVSQQEGVARPTVWYTLRPAELGGRRPAEHVRELLTDSVALRLRSDVPVGTLLSGGLDSSSVTALATRLRRAAGADPPQSFTARSRDPRIDEGRYANAMLELTGSDNHQILPDDRALLDELDVLLWQVDEPFNVAALFSHWKLMGLARSADVTVILDGSGGDEAFHGYHYLLYPSVYFTLIREGHPLRAAQELAWRRRRHGVSVRRSLSGALRLGLPHRLRRFRRPTWLNPQARMSPRPLPPRTLRGHQLFGLTVSPLPMHNHLDDRSSMGVSLEMRNPFLDYRLVEVGLSLQSRDLLHQGLSKWVLREAMRDVLPSLIVNRQDKQGFTTDEAEWFRVGKLGSEIETVFRSARMADRPYFRSDALLGMLAEHRAGKSHQFEIWRAFAVERWLRLFIDPPTYREPVSGAPAIRARDHVIRPEQEPLATSVAGS
jgi:asparagine synthase (glutamine-hydrolysing)